MASLFMRYPNGVSKALTLSYDDGVETDIRLMKILDAHGMKATFNINSGAFAPEGTVYPAGTIHRRMSESQVLAAYKNTVHEVAIHGYTHPYLEQLSPCNATYEILEDKKRLEKLFGKIIRGSAYPFGTYNDTVVEILKNSGIVYSRTTRATKTTKLPENWLLLHPTCHHREPQLMELAENFVKNKNDRTPSMFYLWGHSYEFDGSDNWNVIEEFCKLVSGKKDIWYCTNIEIYDYVQAYNALQFSAEHTMVHNPTATKLWFVYNNVDYTIEPGATVLINQ